MATNPESILDSVKKVLGFEAEYTAFDVDVIMFINMAFGVLRQLGVGSDTGFIISDNSTLWAQYITDLAFLNMVKTYIYLTVRLAFDPPATSFGIDAIKQQIAELGWRINVAAEEANPPSDPLAEMVVPDSEENITIFEGGVMQTYFAPKVITLEYSPVVTADASQGNVFHLVLTGACTINAPINGVDGQHITIDLVPAGFTVTWGSGWNFGDAGLPDLSSDATDVISAYYSEPVAQWFAGYTPGF